jgi:glycosyltransferase involved in cell wall biosynthesis
VSIFLLVSPRINLRKVIVDSLEGVRASKFESFVLEHPAEKVSNLDLELITVAASRPFQAIFYIPTVETSVAIPSAAALSYIRDRLSIPIVMLFSDLEKPFWKIMARALIPFSNIAVSLGGSDFTFGNFPDVKTIRGWTPVPHLRNKPINRDINVSMVGTRNPLYPPRQDAIDYLARHGISIFTGGGQETGYEFSGKEYLEILHRSKIVVNFSRAGQNLRSPNGEILHQVKGRVFEATACGAMLLESENDVTTDWYEPGHEYVEFSSLDDLKNKIYHYSRNHEERRAIAENGFRRHQKNYTSEKFWASLFSEIDKITYK